MDFFAAQDDARARTRRLLLLYLLALITLMLLTHVLGVAVISGILSESHRGQQRFWSLLFRGDIFISFSTLVIATIFLGTLAKIFALRQGGAAVARELGGQEVSRHSVDALETRLMNIVEEMAIASGMPVPRVFLLNGEAGINAFAAGYKLEDAAIAVTRGAIEQLSRDQLQGVIAHEFSHILNSDMRLNIRLIGILNGVLCIFLMGRTVLQILDDSRSTRTYQRRENEKNPLAFLYFAGIALIIVGSVGAFFARLIQAAVSRQREFLADSSAVQFTRNPEGIAGALATIAGIKDGSRLKHFRAPEAEHMFFSAGTGGMLALLFATHPPLPERIMRLTGRIPDLSSIRESAPPTAMRSEVERIVLPQQVAPLTAPAVSSIGTISAAQLSQAQDLIARFPDAIVKATRDLQGAQCILVALMLDRDEVLREKQLPLISSPENPLDATEIFKLAPLVFSLPVTSRLALLDLAIPTLRKLTPRQYTPFNTLLQAIADADQRITLPEYLLLTILRRSIEPLVFSIAPSRYLISNRADLTPSLGAILSAVALVSTPNAAIAQAHFDRITAGLNEWPGLVRSTPEELTFAALDQNLDKLANASPSLKREIIEACTAIIMADNNANAREFELFRAIGAALGCPVPLIQPE